MWLQASDSFGVKALDLYPQIYADPSDLDEDSTLDKLDQLCFGVFILETVTEKPLIGRKLPELVGLLKRKGLGNLEVTVGDSKMKKIKNLSGEDLKVFQNIEQKVKDQLVVREMIKEDLKRNDYDPEPQSRMEEMSLQTKKIGSEEVKLSSKSSKNGGILINIKNSNRVKKTQLMMNKFLKQTQKNLKKLGDNLSKRSKEMQFPKWANSNRIYIPTLEEPVDDSGRVSRNLIRENDVIERKVDEELEKRTKKSKNADQSSSNDYVMSTIIKDEVKAYLAGEESVKKPTWLLNLHELITQLLTSVDDSRPTAKATRNWLLEISESFSSYSKKHGQVKKVLDSKDFLKLSQSTKIKKLNFSVTMQKSDYVSNIHHFDELYKTIPLEEIFQDIPRSKEVVLIYHSKDVSGEYIYSDDEDNESVDSNIPPEKDYVPIQVEAPRSSLLAIDTGKPTRKKLQFNRNDTTMTTEFVLEKDLPPIFGPQANKLLERMEKQRAEVGEVLKPREVVALFDEQKKLPHHKAVSLLKKAKAILDREPNIVTLDAPVIVVGDIHGQYFDLRQVMKFCGKPKKVKKVNSPNTVSTRKSRVSRKSRSNRVSRVLSRLGVMKEKAKSASNDKDKLVFNHEEYLLEQNSEKPVEKKYSGSQIAAGAVPQPLTKTLTLGKTIEIPESPLEKLKSHAEQLKEEKGKKFLFLGDYVDRGKWSCEVLFYLLSLKVHYPESVIMLRGNHECDQMADFYGFKQECELKYGREVYHRCIQVFYSLPISCLINLPNGKRFLGCHGGFSDKILSLEQIAKTERRREPGLEGVLCDVLWSDPVPDNVVQEYNLPISFEHIDFIPNETRGCAKKFGYRALQKFLDDNNLVGIIRAHEQKEEGFQFHFQNAGSKNHVCVTVFSAPNYMDEHGNKGAVLLVHKSVKDRLMHQMKRLKYKYTIDQILKQPDRAKDEYLDLLEPICYKEVAQPDLVAFDDQNLTTVQQIEETCPYMPTIIDEFYNSALDILERYGTAQEQLENYAKEQEEKKKKAEEELEETKKEKAKLKFQDQDGKRVWHSVKLGKGSFKKLKEMRSYASRGSIKSRSSTRFKKTMKKVNEQHPQLMADRIKAASSRMEEMEKKAIQAAKDDSDVKMLSMSTRSIGFDNLATVKKTRAMSTGATAAERKEIMRSLRMSKKNLRKAAEAQTNEAKDDNNVVVGQIQNRKFMKRQRIEIDYKEEWLQLLSSWFSFYAGEDIYPENLLAELKDCVLLCHVASIICERPDLKFYRPKLTDPLSPFQVRRNLIVFQDCCKHLGIQFMFLVFDLENTEYNYVLPALIEFSKKAKQKKMLKLKYHVEFPERLYNEKLGGSDTTVLENAKEADLKDKGLEVGAVTFNGEERLMLQLLFLMIDVFDTGFITEQGIINWAREDGKLIRPENAQQVISAIDYDNDGAVGLRDFFQYAAKLKEEFLSDEYEEYSDYQDSEHGEEDELLFNNQQVYSSEEFQSPGQQTYDPSEAIDMSKLSLNIDTVSEDSVIEN